ncbi:MAG: hypothetical protein ACOX3S_15510 [Anaerolineae bacterium]
MSTSLAFDPGFGNTKLHGAKGGLILPSSVATVSSTRVVRMTGLRTARPPLRIETAAGTFAVGENAHDWGRPVENLDMDRLSNSPETMALFYGAVSRYGLPADPVTVVIGLPIATLIAPEAQGTKQSVRSFFRQVHKWRADGVECELAVQNVRLTSQPVGAMFDYLLDDLGSMPSPRQSTYRKEIGIIGIGWNTVDLLVVRNGTPISRFTAGETLGIRRLLELSEGARLFSLAQLDQQMRAHTLELDGALQVWRSEVFGFVESQWGSAHRRFGAVVGVGGGVLLLREALERRFRDNLHIPDDPIIATARGLYKYALMTERRASS